MEANSRQTKVAVVGAGISGIAAAYYLDKWGFGVTLYEAEPRLGGHTNTIKTPSGTLVDTGFIVCNPKNYPNFYVFLKELGVQLRDTNMTFGFSCRESGLAYIGPKIADLLSHPANLLSWKFVRMLWEQRCFHAGALRGLANGDLAGKTVLGYARELGLSDYFTQNYIQALAASIWSSSSEAADRFPAETFFVFLKNHGMLNLREFPQWQTVTGGSQSYIDAFCRNFKGEICLSTHVQIIERRSNGCTLRSVNGSSNLVSRDFDYVILGTHADQALALLESPSKQEAQYLGAWSYSRNSTILHRDETVLPASSRLWAAWNYLRDTGNSNSQQAAAGPMITYNMNILQGLESNPSYLVSLNMANRIQDSKIIYETVYTHPVFTNKSIATQEKIKSISGTNRTFYCGAYLGYGFHEDGFCSGKDAAEKLKGIASDPTTIPLQS